MHSSWIKQGQYYVRNIDTQRKQVTCPECFSICIRCGEHRIQLRETRQCGVFDGNEPCDRDKVTPCQTCDGSGFVTVEYRIVGKEDIA